EGLTQPAQQTAKPGELRAVVDGIHLSPIRRVDAHDANPAAHRSDYTRLVEGLVVVHVWRRRRAERDPEIRDHVGDADPARDGDAVPAALAVVCELVAVPGKLLERRRLVAELRLLHQEHVR